RPGDAGIDRVAEKRVAEQGRRYVDDVQLGIVDADLLRHQVECHLRAGSRSSTDLLRLADVLKRLDAALGVDDEPFACGIVGVPEPHGDGNLLAEREGEAQSSRDDIEALALERRKKRSARLEGEELRLESRLLEQAEILRHVQIDVVGSGVTIVE